MSSAESFSVEEFVRRVEELYGINIDSPNIFEEFWREALRCFGQSGSNYPVFPCCTQLNHDSWHQPAPKTTEFIDHTRLPNKYPYQFGNVMQLNWYQKFLHPDVHQRTYHRSSRNRWSDFRSYFRLTLEKVDDLTNMFIDHFDSATSWPPFGNQQFPPPCASFFD